MTRWRMWLLPAMIFTVVARIIHNKFKHQNQTAESVQSKIPQPLSKNDEKYAMVGLLLFLWLLLSLDF